MTSLIALLSWWNERPDWLADTVRSLALADVDALVAVDGSYPHMPGGTALSDHGQSKTIIEAASDVGIVVEVAGRTNLWESECAKRTTMFRYAEAHTPDWYLVIDADERIIRAPLDLKARLAATDHDCAEACSLEQPAPVLGAGMEDDAMPTVMASRWVKPRRCLFRAIPGLRVGDAHYDYLTPDGRNLWGDGDEPALTIRSLMIDHRNAHRSPERQEAARTYYCERDERGVEHHRITTWGLAGQDKVDAMNEQLARLCAVNPTCGG